MEINFRHGLAPICADFIAAQICLITVVIVLLLCSCSEKKSESTFPNKPGITGLATPITLQLGETRILLEDFFTEVHKIDSVSVRFLTAKLSGDKKILLLNDEGNEIPFLSELKVWCGTFPYSILLKKLQKNEIGGYNSLLKTGQACPDSLPQLWACEYMSEKVAISFRNSTEEFFAFWENFRLGKGFISQKENNLEIKIPEEAKKLSRSFIRIFSYNKFGTSNELLIPLQHGEVVKSTSALNRSDFHSMILYCLMVDRFSDGNTKNNLPVHDKDVDFKANYQGGDLEGIAKKISENYFSDLNVNTIWISPVVQNPVTAYREFPEPHRKYSGYHGYWPVSSTEIDFRFGNDDDFKKLIDEAHKKNINVLLDFVSNHIHEEHPLYKLHPDWFTKIDLQDGRKNIRLWDEFRLTTWFDTFLPDIDYSKKEVIDAMSDSAMYWLKQFSIDGFRHDATKHVPEEFWRALTNKIKNEIENPPGGRNIFQIGETFGSRELIANYVNSGKQNGQFDFNLYFDARSVFALEDEPFKRLDRSLKTSFEYYGNHSLMGNITGNHDLPRFISLASGALKFNEDDKNAGWERNIMNKNPIGYKRLKMLEAFMLTIPGIPVIYYGDEIGMAGAGDPDNRRMMMFENLTAEEKDVKTTLEKITKIRKNNISLLYGDFSTLHQDDNTYAFTRTYFNEIAIVVFNKSSEEKKIQFEIPERFSNIKLKGNFGAEFNFKKNTLSVDLNGNAFEILTN